MAEAAERKGLGVRIVGVDLVERTVAADSPVVVADKAQVQVGTVPVQVVVGRRRPAEVEQASKRLVFPWVEPVVRPRLL